VARIIARVGLIVLLAGLSPVTAAGSYAQTTLRHSRLTVHGVGCGATGCGAPVLITPPQDLSDPNSLRWGACGNDQPLDAANSIPAAGLPCYEDYFVGTDYPDGPPTVLILTAEQCRTAQQPSVVDGQGTQGPPDCSHAARFLGWGGDCGGVGVGTDAGGACTLVMDQDRDVYVGYSYFECLGDLPSAEESQDNDARQVAGRFTASGYFDPAQCGYQGNTLIVWGPELTPPLPPGGNWGGLQNAPACPIPAPQATPTVPVAPPALFLGLPGLGQILSTSSLEAQRDLLMLLQQLNGGCSG
jgi:hypothetical protein